MKKRTLSRTIRLQVLGLLSLTVLLPTWETNGQARKTSLEELTHTSTAVVLGKATRLQSFWNEDQSKILTEVTIHVEEQVKGNAEAETTVTIPGGRVGNTVYEVTDMPVFVDGEESLVFLWQHPSGRQLVTAGTRGKFQVVDDRQLGKRVVLGLTGLLPPDAGKTMGANASGDRIPLDAVMLAIQSLAND